MQVLDEVFALQELYADFQALPTSFSIFAAVLIAILLLAIYVALRFVMQSKAQAAIVTTLIIAIAILFSR